MIPAGGEVARGDALDLAVEDMACRSTVHKRSAREAGRADVELRMKLVGRILRLGVADILDLADKIPGAGCDPCV